MILFSTPTVLLALVLMSALHWTTIYLKGIIAKISICVNIALHILVMIPMLVNKFTIEEAVLVYMISVFVYTLMAFIRYKLDEKSEMPSKNESTSSDENIPSDEELAENVGGAV